MTVTNLNPDTDIGASGWLVEIDGHRLLLDAGMHPKREGRDGLPLLWSGRHADVDAIAISHCHHDHVGSLPVACAIFPGARTDDGIELFPGRARPAQFRERHDAPAR